MNCIANAKPNGGLSKATIWLMTIGAGVVVANNYYNQPLLAMMATDFGVSQEAASQIAMITQVGYATGLLLILPLGDMFHRKRIILIDFLFIISSLLALAFSKTLHMAVVASFFVGLDFDIADEFDPLLIKALAIHSAKYPEAVKLSQVDKIKWLFISYIK